LAAKSKSYFNGQDSFLNGNENLLSKPHEKIFIKIPRSSLEKLSD
jgi:hypothetical protein